LARRLSAAENITTLALIASVDVVVVKEPVLGSRGGRCSPLADRERRRVDGLIESRPDGGRGRDTRSTTVEFPRAPASRTVR